MGIRKLCFKFPRLNAILIKKTWFSIKIIKIRWYIAEAIEASLTRVKLDLNLWVCLLCKINLIFEEYGNMSYKYFRPRLVIRILNSLPVSIFESTCSSPLAEVLRFNQLLMLTFLLKKKKKERNSRKINTLHCIERHWWGTRTTPFTFHIIFWLS